MTNLSKTRVLIVEDEPDIAGLMKHALERGGEMDVEIVNTGAAALKCVMEEPPGLVLLDLNLPKIGGLQVLQRLRSEARTQFLPVVVLTSSDEDRDLIDGYRLGANSYVRKPVDFNQFTESVRNLGLYWLVLNRVPPRP